MKHIFIINPDAGKGKAEKEFLPKILKAVKGRDISYEIHRAMSLEAGSRFVRTRCESGETVRFYACGGDGTLNGVLNNIIGHENAELACIPAGSGNDFVRNFKQPKNFLNIERLIEGDAILVDAMKFNGRYAINTLNIGMDCSVVNQAAAMKKRPAIGGPGAYLGGVAKVIFKGAHFPMALEFEGGEILEEDFLLTAVANGSFCGGGFKSAPRARLNDGFFDVCIVRQVAKGKIVPLMMKYKAGAHLDDEECRKYVTYKQCKRMTITPRGESGKLIMAVDGEIGTYETVTVELVPEAARFVIPKGSSL